MHLPPAWGDIPGWITALATFGLLIGAIFTVINAIEAFRAQAAELAILAAQRDRDNDERRRAQAAKVFTGAPQSPRQTKGGETIVGTVSYVRNTSDLPIYDAQLWESDRPDRDPDDLGVIMPGKRISARGGVIYNSRETALSSVILTFQDTAGFRWIRMPDGNLIEQSLPTVHQSVQAAREPSLPDGYHRLSDQIAGSVVDAIVVHPRSRGELHMPGEYSYGRSLIPKADTPRARRHAHQRRRKQHPGRLLAKTEHRPQGALHPRLRRVEQPGQPRHRSPHRPQPSRPAPRIRPRRVIRAAPVVLIAPIRSNPARGRRTAVRWPDGWGLWYVGGTARFGEHHVEHEDALRRGGTPYPHPRDYGISARLHQLQPCSCGQRHEAVDPEQLLVGARVHHQGRCRESRAGDLRRLVVVRHGAGCSHTWRRHANPDSQ